MTEITVKLTLSHLSYQSSKSYNMRTVVLDYDYLKIDHVGRLFHQNAVKKYNEDL
jgi:hypothetical protein